VEYVLNILTFLDTFFIYIHCIKHNKEEMARSRNSVRLTLEKILRLGKGRNMYPIVVAAMRTKPRIKDCLLRRRTRALLPQLTLGYMAGLSVLWHDNPHQEGIIMLHIRKNSPVLEWTMGTISSTHSVSVGFFARCYLWRVFKFLHR
jgi:hypothetical protein